MLVHVNGRAVTIRVRHSQEPRRPTPERSAEVAHLDRLAVVYVRQSTQKQVLDNRESTDRQYQLADRAVALGWRHDRVLVIDGATGTYLQGLDLSPEDYGGDDLDGCPEILNVTRPDVIERFHRDFLEVGVDTDGETSPLDVGWGDLIDYLGDDPRTRPPRTSVG